MTNNKDVSKQLHELVNKTEQTLRLYYNKQKWPSIFPTLAELAQLYAETYQNTPNALHSYLTLHFKQLSPTTNLIVKKCILVCIISQGQGYSYRIRQELLVACLASFLCVKNESDKLLTAKPLTDQGKKIWKIRYQLAVKVLQHGGSVNKQAARMMSRLSPYCDTLKSKRLSPLYDNITLIVAIAQIIATALVQKPKPNALAYAVKKLYLASQNDFVRDTLNKLATQFSHYPVGCSAQYKGQHALLLQKNEKNQIICTFKDHKIDRLVKTQQRLNFEFTPISSADKHLLFKVWSHIESQPLELSPDGFDATYSVIDKLGQNSFSSFRAIEKTIAPFPYIEQALQQAAKQYNRESQKGANTRHCLTMVGLNTASLLCQRVLIEQVISQLKHPFAVDIWHKYQQLSLILATLTKQAYGQAYESILSPISAVIAFMLKHHDIDIKRFTCVSTQSDTATPYSLARLFGFLEFSSDKLDDYFAHHFDNSEPHRAFKQSEREKNNSLSEEAKTFVAIKVLSMMWSSAYFQPTAWQRLVLENQIKKFGWESEEQLHRAILELSLHSMIE
ncbi:hypothetical protein [Pseudoalteromonas luteoviolacea]|uniref:Uncharacterized protein n=1 Tax=Pseudoalteromonas luteoviolacea S4054 TaxID=1129367 RepID=A0A0F6ABW4_9GAMM|nr:hypothetical protein [Pseudoalteromonas luteoviolacea]AOT10580.1 hypothetical protein S4054249_22215 [Pseudoalteromonas luteoviolacea]AOT15352.1 hypothetical protein S40542_21380 [Pseudoalteromonas luteoviolacea]AOT20399.1 hypothetical protein S4054_22130 [Pseudoalteromonas luteoviolacea]KKE83675.1 hypothetical protein N479_12680 [Pseudoalteromonas luteoviolacea S4054]KZN71878.1 hypothetical protein N481_17040 [Pseudoalteromonas luteoviolacea S4047-1]